MKVKRLSNERCDTWNVLEYPSGFNKDNSIPLFIHTESQTDCFDIIKVNNERTHYLVKPLTVERKFQYNVIFIKFS